MDNKNNTGTGNSNLDNTEQAADGSSKPVHQPFPTGTEDTSNQQEKTVVFSDDLSQNSILYGVALSDPVSNRAEQMRSDISNFLARPIQIFDGTWGSAFPSFSINPWDRFLRAPSIVRKLQNYKLLRGTLKIKIVLNGSPFHSGRLVVAMKPTQGFNNTINATYDTAITVTNKLNLAAAAQSDQIARVLGIGRPHVFLNPAKSEQSHIHWPFFYATDWIDVTDPNAYHRFGVLEFFELTGLKYPDIAVPDVGITVFAWMDNIQITGATNVAPNSEGDRAPVKRKRKNKASVKDTEYSKEGIISKPASVLAGWASKLTDAPIIGPYARATEIAASGVSKIAALFGFSNPVETMDMPMYTHYQLGRMANAMGKDPIPKFTIDPMQELTIDPRTVGMPANDEMAFMNIASRHGYIGFVNWTESNAQGARLFGTRIHPTNGMTFADPSSTQQFKTMTPLSFIAMPFNVWTGDIVVRLQFVCSQFHRGRVKVVYTPDCNGSVLSDPITSEHFSHVVDLTKETDVSFTISWSQAASWRYVMKPDNTTPEFTIGTDGGLLDDPNQNCNGRLDVFVVNELQGSTTITPVQINVFFSAGDNFRVAAPNRTGRLTWTQDGGTYDPVATAEGDTRASGAYGLVPFEDAPEQLESYLLNGDGSDDMSAVMSCYYGEDIRSIRTMLKRYDAYMTAPFYNPNGAAIGSRPNTRYPQFPIGPSVTGYGSSGILDYSAGTDSMDGYTKNLVYLSFMRYYAQGFVGWRGGVRYKYGNMSDNVTAAIVYRNSDAPGGGNVAASFNIIASYAKVTAATTLPSQWFGYASINLGEGGQLYDYQNSSHYGFEIPFYRPVKYLELHDQESTGLHMNGPTWSTKWTLKNKAYATDSDQRDGYDLSVAAGEDFSFFFFIGCPPISVTVATPE